MARQIIDGPAGTRWTNDTDKVRYQFHCSYVNTCGICYQYANKIGPWWPIPIHFSCRCRQTAVKPGGQAPEPFVDFRKLVDALPHSEQVKVVGASAYKLIETGVVKWSDVVTEGRIRTLREVVSREKLSIDRMVAAGVRPYLAEAAHAAVHTAAHEIAEAQRLEALARLTEAGIPQEAIVNELSKRLAARVSIAAGPQGEWAGGTLPGSGASTAAELAAAMTLWRGGATPPKKRKPPEPPPAAPPPARPGEAIDPDRPIGERIRDSRHLDAKMDAILSIESEVEANRLERKALDQQWATEVAKLRSAGVAADEIQRRIQPLQDRWNKLLDEALRIKRGDNAKVRDALRIPLWDRQEWEHSDGLGDWSNPTAQATVARREAREWLQAITAAPAGTVAKPKIRTKWNALPDVRAHADETYERIQVSTTGSTETAAHEMGHRIEHVVPGVKAAAQEFLAHRVKGQAPRKLKELFPDAGYDDHEEGRDDDFARTFGPQSSWYVGKHYAHGSTEVISMGVEKLYNDPLSFAQTDPEYCRFILGILDGSLRKP